MTPDLSYMPYTDGRAAATNASFKFGLFGLWDVGEGDYCPANSCAASNSRVQSGGDLRLPPLHVDCRHGFVEGDDLGRGAVDVFVTEGFTGNIAVKTAEGTARQLSQYLRDAMSHSLMSHIGFLFARKALMALRDKMSPRASGGMFLGLDGVVIKAHGDADAYAGAIELGYDMIRQELLGKIREMIAQTNEARPAAAAQSSAAQ